MSNFTDWTTDHAEDINNAANNALGHYGLTSNALRILKGHVSDLLAGYDTDADGFTENDLEDFLDSHNYDFETYDGPERAALVHWAWNSDLDMTDYVSGEMDASAVWQAIEYAAMSEITAAGREALRYAVTKYAETLED